MKTKKIYLAKYTVITKCGMYTANNPFAFETYELAEKDIKKRMEEDEEIKCAFIEEIFVLLDVKN